MHAQFNKFLILGAMLSAIAAALHLACIYFGAPLFRFLGTEAMAVMYESGNTTEPIIVCILLACIFLTWSAYALSGAGVIPKLPLLRTALVCISLIYLARGIAFPLLAPYFPENTMAFWYCSSAIVLIIGLIHVIGLVQVWNKH
jgi:hypothetical protein